MGFLTKTLWDCVMVCVYACVFVNENHIDGE